MKKETISRRKALKRMALYAGGALLSPGLFGFAQEAFGRGAVRMTDEDRFFIRRIAEVVAFGAGTVGSGNGLAAGGRFAIYSIVHAGHPVRKGTLTFDRQPDGLIVDVCREGSFGHHQYTQITERTAGDFFEPLSWDYVSRLSERPGSMPLYGVPIAGRGRVEMNMIVFQENDTERRIEPQSDNVTLSWNLFPAVERLSGSEKSYRFDVIDECDIYGGPRLLRPYRQAVLEMGGRQHRLYGWIAAGHAAVPWFFWLDDAGKLLFANTGMVVFVKE